MKLSDVTLEQIETLSNQLTGEFTGKYWRDQAEILEDKMDLDPIDAKALVRLAMASKTSFATIRDNINFAMRDANRTKENMRIKEVKELYS